MNNREDMGIFYGTAAAIGEAKYWGRPMNDWDEQDPNDKNDATKQIASYLRDVADYTDGKTNWGILTNGKLWRLFQRRADYTVENCLEVDLEAILREEDLEAFKYFYVLFSRESFVLQPTESVHWIQSLVEQSEEYSSGITDHLKELIFEEVFDTLVQGFVRFRRNSLHISVDQETPDTKRAIYQGCLTLLYRLLFLLNAESRELLPMRNPGYRQRSLRALMERIHQERAEQYDPDHDLSGWQHLERLFAMMDDGASSFDLPRYNGGLFHRPSKTSLLQGLTDEEIGPWFLENHKLADPFLYDAIQKLTFDPNIDTPGSRAFIDYSSLGVRHLGEIYEGLLEFKVEIAEDEPVCAVGSRKKPHWKKQSEVTDEDTVHFTKQIGEAYITNDKGERKATGSYYTPHYIVQYIVEHTVGEQLKRFEKEKCWYDDITGSEPDFRTLYAEIAEEEADEEKQRLDTLWGACKSDGERRTFLLGHLDREWGKHRFDLATRALNLKVLDPAMGSSHFLVHIVDVISESIATYLNQYTDSPVSKELEALRGVILQNVQKQGVKINQEKLSDVNLIKRMVMKRCVYGVDLNPMAGELAKLSLWLASFTVGAPLSFLDHHLRCGNSLIGTTVSEVRSALEGEKKETHTKLSLLTSQFTGLMRAVELMQEVGELSDATIGEVEESQARYGRAIGELAPFKALLDVWLSEHFRNKGAQEAIKQRAAIVEAAIKHVLGRSQVFDSNRQITLGIVTKAFRLAGSKHFFHWELGFPEVWYEGGKQRANPGFDAVIGNPPYQFGEQIPSSLRAISPHYELAVGQYDTYWLFFERIGELLLRTGGAHGFIVPDALLARDETAVVRRYLNQFRLLSLAHVGPVFDDPDVSAAVVAWQKTERGETAVRIGRRVDNQVNIKEIVPQGVFLHTPNSRWLVDLPGGSLRILHKLLETCIPLRKLVRISRGEELGARDLLPLTSKCVPILRGEDVFALGSCNPRVGIRKSDIHKGMAIYMGPKLVFVKTGSSIVCTVDSDGFVTLQSVYNLQPNDKVSPYFLAAILKSRLLTWFARRVFTDYKKVFPQFNQSTVGSLPTRPIFFTTPIEERANHVLILRGLYKRSSIRDLLENVAHCVPKDRDGMLLVLTTSLSAKRASQQGLQAKDTESNWALDSPESPSGYDRTGSPVEKSDVVHDFLEFLAKEIIDLSSKRCCIVSRFWTDLEGLFDAQTCARMRKGRQEKTIANRAKECRLFVSADSTQVRRLEDALAWSEVAFKSFTKLLAGRIFNLSNLLDVYRKYATEYKGLIERREATDRLIDQIVYRLYGLTDEEIRIVEEAKRVM